MSDFDAVFEGQTEEEPKQEQTSPPAINPIFASGAILFFDLETCPDWQSAARIGIAPIVVPPPTPEEDLPEPSVAELTEAEVKERFGSICEPPEEYMQLLVASERRRKKPRKGVSDFLERLSQGSELHAQREEQLKSLSVCPETNRIVCFGWKSDGGRENVYCVKDGGDGNDAGNGIGERHVLEAFWKLAKSHQSICGYNVLEFDLPTILVRSIKLGVPSSRTFSTKPWDNDVIDVYKRRFPGSWASGEFKKLKQIAPLMGIDVPANDTDGGCVNEMVENGEWDALANYCMSDVKVTAELYKLYCGYFC